MFEEQVTRHPHSWAVCMDSESLTYTELNARANQLARCLRKRGVGPETLVAVCLERSPDAVVALLGVLKAGGAYVPLDPAYPAERISYILSDSRCRLVIANRRATLNIPSSDTPVLLVDVPPPEMVNLSGENLGPTATPGNLAYVIYTSGSTGKPKGVQVEHRNVVNFLRSMQKEPGINEFDVVAWVTTPCFDIAGLEIHLPLASGARITFISREEAVDGSKLLRRIEKCRVTLMQATPATWRLLLQAGWRGDKELKILCGGEAFPGDLAAELLPRCKSLWNMYGPTETTIWSSLHRVTRAQSNIPIGLPIANTHFHVVDENMRPVVPGTEGELLIGGGGVARGYLNRPELNSQKFIADPFCPYRTDRLYRTGDLARYLPSGNLVCLGRMDHQVKIRGFRIELGEIESVLATHPCVQQCVVVAREDSPDKRLVAYVVAAVGQKPITGVLRDFLAKKLPDYMLPAAFVLLPTMPLTPNGKVDRKALPMPTRENSMLDHEYVAPRTDLEKKLVKLWESTLRITPIGVTDNIFDLGVNSIIAAQLFARIEKILGRNLPPGPLFQAPTIRLLATLIEEHGSGLPKCTSLVAIQPKGTKSPLFCAHGAAGTVLFFQELATRLGPERPVYAFQAQGLHGRDVPHTSIAEMAEHYIQEMRTVQPGGPYLLAGWCFGGLVVFEMAQQLRRAGEKVEMLAMFNAPSAPEYEYRPSARNLAPVADRLTEKWQEFRSLPAGEKLRYVARKVKGQIVWRTLDLYIRATGFVYRKSIPVRRLVYTYFGQRRRPLPDYIRDKYFLYMNSRLERHYKHRPYPGKIVVFRDQLPYRDSALGWGRFTRDVEVYDIPVSINHHRALLQEPAVGLLAAKIEEYLSRRAKFHAIVGDAAKAASLGGIAV